MEFTRSLICLGIISCILWHKSTTYRISVPIGVIIGPNEDDVVAAIDLAFRHHNMNPRSTLPFLMNLEVEKLQNDDLLQLNRAVCRLINQGVFAILATSNAQTYPTLVSYCDRYHIPLVSPAFPEVPRDMTTAYGVSIRPQTFRAVLHLLRIYKWDSVIYIYDSEDGTERLQRMLQLSTSVLRLEVVGIEKVRNAEEAQTFLRDLETTQRTSTKNVILDTSPLLARDIIVKHVHDIHVSKRNYHFILMQPVQENFWQYHSAELGATKVTSLQMINPESETFRQFIATWQRSGAGTQELSPVAMLSYDGGLLLAKTFSRIFREAPHTLQPNYMRERRAANAGSICLQQHLSQWEHGAIIAQYLKQCQVPEGITGNIQVEKDSGQRENYTFDIVESSPLGKVKVGVFSDKLGLEHLQTSHYVYPETSPIIDEHKVYTVSSILVAPYLMTVDPSAIRNGANDEYEGFLKDLMDILAKDMKISYKIRIVEDGQIGRFDESTRQWDGMIGEVVKGRADLALGPLTITRNRLKVVDFTVPFQSAGISMMVKKPTRLGSSIYFPLQAFSRDVWFCILGSFVAISVLLFAMSHFTGSPDDIQSAGSRVQNKFSIFASFWFVAGSMLLRDNAIYPRSASTRIVSSAWWVCTLLIVALYLANMAAIIFVNITRSDSGPHLDTVASRTIASVLQEAIDSGKPDVSIIGNGASLEFIENSKVPLHTSYWKYLKKKPHLITSTVEKGVAKVRKSEGRHVFLLESELNEYFSHQMPCDTMPITGLLNNRGYGIATPIGSPLRDVLDSVLQKKLESKEVERIYRRWWVDRSECVVNASSGGKDRLTSPVTISDLATLYYTLVIATLLVCLFTAGQHFIRKRREKQRRDPEVNGVTLGQTPMPLPDYLDDDVDSLPPPPLPDE